MERGALRVYLGSAPGVGKTFAMLSEGTRRQQRGAHVILGQIDDRPRTLTHNLVSELKRSSESRSPRPAPHEKRVAKLDALDLDAVLALRPEVVLVDDLASWWREVETLLDAGIDVVSTLGVEHIASLTDVMTAALGHRPEPTVPDAFLRRAEQIELVDMTPEALLRRIAHGNVFPPDEQADVVSQWSDPETLNTLRRHALLWIAEGLRPAAEVGRRDRIVVAITGAVGNDKVILRAARLALRSGGELVGVHVIDRDRGLIGSDGKPRRSDELLAAHRQLVLDLGGSFHELADDDIPGALVSFARSLSASRLVVGASRRSRLAELTSGSIVREVIRRAGDLDVHVIADVAPSMPRSSEVSRWWSGRGVFSRWRVISGFVAGLVSLLAVTWLARSTGAELSVVLSLFILIVVVAARIGGRLPAFTVGLVAPLLANYFFVEPRGTLRIAERSSVVELAAFLAVALLTSSAVGSALHQSRRASSLASEAELLSQLASRRTGNPADDLAMLTDAVRTLFGLDSLEVATTQSGYGAPNAADTTRTRAKAGVTSTTALPTLLSDLGDGFELRTSGPPLDASSQRLLPLVAAQFRSVLAMAKAEADATNADSLREADALKLSILQTVSHDLRTPLAGIKAAVSSLREGDVEWSEEDEDYFLETIDENTDRLTSMVSNVLDFTRLQSGMLRPMLRRCALEEIVPAALFSLGRRSHGVALDIQRGLPDVSTDPPLLERVIANVIANAVTWSPPDRGVTVHASQVHGESTRGLVAVQIVDHGPGIAVRDRARVMEPFERVPGTPQNSTGGVGLGLAISGGLMTALGGTIRLRDTPGGGLTVELRLPTEEHRADELRPSSVQPSSEERLE